MPQQIDLKSFFDEVIVDGSEILIEGYNHAIPMASVRALLNSERRGLSVFRQSADLVSDLLVKEGRLDRAVFGWAGSPLGGELTNISRSEVSGEVKIERLGHPIFSSALVAGAMGLDFIQIPETSDTNIHPAWRYEGHGSDTHCVNAMKPDFCIAHVQEMDRSGNALFKGIRGGLEYSPYACKNTFITAESLVESLSPSFGDILIPSELISFYDIIETGAAPFSLQGYYKSDEKELQKIDSYLKEKS